jgi:hypothetical protein
LEGNLEMRNYEPKITIGVLLEVERDTGVKTLQSPGDLLMSITNMSSLLYYSVKYNYPRLSKQQFLEALTPEDLSAAVPKLNKGLEDFFSLMKQPEAEEKAAED